MIRTAFFYAVLVPSTTFFSTLAVVFGLLRVGHGGYDWIHRNWSRSLLWAAGVRVHVEGLEHLDKDGGLIIVANHQSYFDIWALMAALPVSLRFIAKRELARIPILAPAMRAAGHVFIDRDTASTAKEAIRRAGDRMRSERLAIVLFPEGTRSRDGELGRFLRGSFGLAIEMQADIVPVGLIGGRHISAPGVKRVRSGTMMVRLAPPTSLAGLGKSDRAEVTQQTRATIERLLHPERDL